VLINPRQSSNVLNVHGAHSVQNPQLSAGRTISIRGPHVARGQQFAHPCSIQIHCFKKHSVRYELCFKQYL